MYALIKQAGNGNVVNVMISESMDSINEFMQNDIHKVCANLVGSQWSKEPCNKIVIYHNGNISYTYSVVNASKI